MVDMKDFKKMYQQMNGSEKAKLAIRDLVETRKSGRGFLDCEDFDVLRARNDVEREEGRRLLGMFRHAADLWPIADREMAEFGTAMSELICVLHRLIPHQIDFESVRTIKRRDLVAQMLSGPEVKVEGDKIKMCDDLFSKFSEKVTRVNSAVARIRAIDGIVREVEAITGADPFSIDGMREYYGHGLGEMARRIAAYHTLLDSLVDIQLDDSLRLNGEAMDVKVYEDLRHKFLENQSGYLLDLVRTHG